MHQEYDRAKLLEEVWTEPVQTVALRYQLSDVGLKKLCMRRVKRAGPLSRQWVVGSAIRPRSMPGITVIQGW